MQQSIPYYQIRGGSSKGLYFKADDLPADENNRNDLLIRVMEGSTLGDPRQIDGLGGATSLTSKVAIVSKSQTPDVDLDYLFVQVVVGKGKVSTSQTCGNILSGVLPFAISTGLIKATSPTTRAKINIMNTGGVCEVIVQTPNGEIETEGFAQVDGVMGTAAPIICNYLDTLGSTCGALLPSGNAIDKINDVEVTCIDNGMPIVIIRAIDLNIQGNESKEKLESNELLKQQIEAIRLKAGILMKLGDVAHQTIPKMCLISSPEQGGTINTRMFIPHIVHEAIGVLAAVSVATALLIPDCVCNSILKSQLPIHSAHSIFSIEHPSGEFTVNLEYEYNESESEIKIHKSGVIRTARILSKGVVFV